MDNNKKKLMKKKKWLGISLSAVLACTTVVGLFVFASAEGDESPVETYTEAQSLSADILTNDETEGLDQTGTFADTQKEIETSETEEPTAATETETESGVTEAPSEETQAPTAGDTQGETPTSESEVNDSEETEPEAETEVPDESAIVDVPDYPPAWAESGQQYLNGNLTVAEELLILDKELEEHIEVLRDTFNMPEDIEVVYDKANIADIFAVYALKQEMTENFPYSVEIRNQEEKFELHSIFWDMTRVSGTVKYDKEQKTYLIQVERFNYEEAVKFYNIGETYEAQLKKMVSDENSKLLSSLLNNSILSKLTDEEFAAVEDKIADDVYGERRSALLAALSLEGKVNYFWGGKSYHTGWDERWGELRTVTSEGSVTSGTARSFGLDCSGFVTWAFINAGGSKDVYNYIGDGTTNQWINSAEISWEEAQPGDLLFAQKPNDAGINHIGIVVGRDDNGNLQVVHCSSGRNNVVVTGTNGFNYVRRPYIYSDGAKAE